MIIKAEVTQHERELIRQLAKTEGKSVSAYIKEKALNRIDSVILIEPLMCFIETQAEIAQKINSIVTNTFKNKVVYETDILQLMNRMNELEEITSSFLKESITLMKRASHGHTRQ